MNSKLIALVAVGVFVSTVADAQTRRRSAPPKRTATYETTASPEVGMAGCGLGSMVVEDKGKWAQVGAAFLNGTGMQTFAISFGTSNCVEDGVAEASREKDVFVEANLADLRRDVAAGEGEYLSSVAELYGCEGSAAEGFGSTLHQAQDEFSGASAKEASRMMELAASGCQG